MTVLEEVDVNAPVVFVVEEEEEEEEEGPVDVPTSLVVAAVVNPKNKSLKIYPLEISKKNKFSISNSLKLCPLKFRKTISNFLNF